MGFGLHPPNRSERGAPVWILWAYVQSGPDEWEFQACDRLFVLPEQAGLKVLVQLTVECAPYWIHAWYPGIVAH